MNNELNNCFELLPDISEIKDVGTSKNGKIDKTGIFYHVTSHSFNGERIYNFDTSMYRTNLLLSICQQTGVRLFFSAVQPTHSHDVVMCRSIEDLMKTFRLLNSKVAHYIKSKNPKHYAFPGVRVFQFRPAYQIVESYSHLLFLAKYLYDNGEELRKQGKKPPYCCFDELERGFFNNYPKHIYSKVFGLEIEEIIEKCQSLSKNEFMEFCDKLYMNVNKTDEKNFFHNNLQK